MDDGDHPVLSVLVEVCPRIVGLLRIASNVIRRTLLQSIFLLRILRLYLKFAVVSADSSLNAPSRVFGIRGALSGAEV